MFQTLTQAQRHLEHKDFKSIHNKALEAVKELKSKEAHLIKVLQEVDANKVHRRMGHNSLYQYCLALGLSESQSLNYISVARKAKNLPQLQMAIESGEISISKARTLNSVINERNQEKWLELAAQMPQRKLQREVAKANPREAVPESMRHVSDTVLNLQAPISEELYQKIERIREILRTKEKRAVSIEQSLEFMAEECLEKHDPIRKAERCQARQTAKKQKVDRTDPKSHVALHTNPDGHRKSIPSFIKHQITLRDNGQCRYHLRGKRCQSRSFLDIHHKTPVSRGGSDDLENLITLCSSHHKLIHRQF